MENISTINLLQKKHENSFTSQLLMCLPAIYQQNANGNQYQQIIHALQAICYNPRPDDDLEDLFK